MENKFLQIFLSNVLNSGSINSLLNAGLNFRQIATLTDKAIGEGFISVGKSDIQLSEKGMLKLLELRHSKKNIPKSKWIEVEEKSRIRKITKDFIFLPRQDELP